MDEASERSGASAVGFLLVGFLLVGFPLVGFLASVGV
jgi:hypothetical protein